MIPQIRPALNSPFAVINFNEIDRLNSLPSSSIRVYLALGAHANAEGTCWPGRKRLAEICDLNREQVSKATQILDMAGLIEKSYRENGRVVYRLPLHRHGAVSEPTPPRVNPDTPPCQKRHPIEQTSEQNPRTERAQAEPPAPEPPAQVTLSEPLRTPPPAPVIQRTPPPDCVPEDWLTLAAEMRPDLHPAVIQLSAERFLDDRRSKAIKLADWLPSWKNWIRNERGPKPVQQTTTTKPAYAIEQPSRYAGWTPGKPANKGPEQTPEQVQAEFEANMKRLGATFDPATGIWKPKDTPPPPKPAQARPSTVVIQKPTMEDQLRRDAATVLELIRNGATREQIREVNAELKRRRDAENSG